ncbi:hypothetical protein L0666_05295 [Octadecabacter sp. CECT 8868]|uniref:hypothetical protein n=1 Tax=Octadecabacter algicola TaxID=2909342 RepID=UPI001F1AD51B|nr:hypothetical protein [Octadecabacter algicola]MCF2904393.1 hypothetical protein [Octadecabacter algicola]
MPVRKIATCCYCGTRAALVLAEEGRHELSCSSCGAPLHDLKMLPKRAVHTRSASSVKSQRTAKTTHPKQPHPRPRKVEKRRKRKGLWYEIAEEIWDEIEDIFD